MARRYERVATYRDVPIWWDGGRYVAFLTLRGGNVYIPGGGFHTVAAAKKFVGQAINAGAVAHEPPRANPSKRQTYTAFCDRCYNSTLATGVSKTKAERAAVGHMNAYGHSTHVIADDPKPNPGVAKLKTTSLPGVRVGFPPARAGGLRNPGLTVVRNPSRSRGSRVLTDRVLAIQYIHGADGKAYEHKFKRGVTVEFLPDGSARLYRKDGRPLWKDVV